MVLQNSSDRYDHDMTAEGFLAWLRVWRGYHGDIPQEPVATYLGVMGFNVVDTCYDTVTLVDCCGCRHVRILPVAIARALRDADTFRFATLIEILEARI